MTNQILGVVSDKKGNIESLLIGTEEKSVIVNCWNGSVSRVLPIHSHLGKVFFTPCNEWDILKKIKTIPKLYELVTKLLNDTE